MAWGRPRATYDADILIELSAPGIARLLSLFPQPDWYVDEDTAPEATRSAGEFKVIHAATALGIDFWRPAPRAADALRLARRRRETLAGVETWVLSAEDTTLAKLEWLRAAPSVRQRDDVAGILAVQRGRLDMEYLNNWAAQLDVSALLGELMTSCGADLRERE